MQQGEADTPTILPMYSADAFVTPTPTSATCVTSSSPSSYSLDESTGPQVPSASCGDGSTVPAAGWAWPSATEAGRSLLGFLSLRPLREMLRGQTTEEPAPVVILNPGGHLGTGIHADISALPVQSSPRPAASRSHRRVAPQDTGRAASIPQTSPRPRPTTGPGTARDNESSAAPLLLPSESAAAADN
eukprot:GHVT01031912.1.p1 GENE.GHVT01031912.1~~GHVT01031912.1.p1  ORF type:complete len:188 (+),score=27.08 GHVT01031912.1:281-844(+)